MKTATDYPVAFSYSDILMDRFGEPDLALQESNRMTL